MAKAKTGQKRVAKKKAPVQKGVPQAAPEHYFFLVDGRALKDYKELADALDEMADHVYHHHVNWERNDFATWVQDIFKDADLAHRLRNAEGKHHSQIVIYRHILENS